MSTGSSPGCSELVLWSEPGGEGALPALAAGLAELFPALRTRVGGAAAVPPASRAGGKIDAGWFLREVVPEGLQVLWVVEGELASGVHPSIAGAAAGRGAVVSRAWAGEGGVLLGVAAHEVGHLQGLAHCGGRCLMRPVHSRAAARTRPLRLCRRCRAKLAIA